MLADANSNPATARHRLSGSERRAAIVHAAIELFSKRGFRGTTTRELALAVGVSEPVLYQHFATKRDLYTAIVDHLIADTSARFKSHFEELGAGCDDRTFFTWLGSEILSWYCDTTAQVRLLMFSALEGHELADLWHKKATAEFIGWVESYVRRRMEEGAFHCENPAAAARFFIGAMAHYGMISVLHPCECPATPRDQVVRQYVDIYFSGMMPR